MLHGGEHSVLTLGDQFCDSFRNSPFQAILKQRPEELSAVPETLQQYTVAIGRWTNKFESHGPLYVKKCTIVLFENVRFLGTEQSLEPAHWQESSA